MVPAGGVRILTEYHRRSLCSRWLAVNLRHAAPEEEPRRSPSRTRRRGSLLLQQPRPRHFTLLLIDLQIVEDSKSADPLQTRLPLERVPPPKLVRNNTTLIVRHLFLRQKPRTRWKVDQTSSPRTAYHPLHFPQEGANLGRTRCGPQTFQRDHLSEILWSTRIFGSVAAARELQVFLRHVPRTIEAFHPTRGSLRF